MCALEQILPDTGVAALIDGWQVAVFRLADDRTFAIDNGAVPGRRNGCGVGP